MNNVPGTRVTLQDLNLTNCTNATAAPWGGALFIGADGVLINTSITNSKTTSVTDRAWFVGGGGAWIAGNAITNAVEFTGNSAAGVGQWQGDVGGGGLYVGGSLTNTGSFTATSNSIPTCAGCLTGSFGGGVYVKGDLVIRGGPWSTNHNSIVSSGCTPAFGGGTYVLGKLVMDAATSITANGNSVTAPYGQSSGTYCYGNAGGGGLALFGLVQNQPGTIIANSNSVKSGSQGGSGRAQGAGLYLGLSTGPHALSGITANDNQILDGDECGGGGVFVSYQYQHPPALDSILTLSNVTITGNQVGPCHHNGMPDSQGGGYVSQWGGTAWGPGRNISGNTTPGGHFFATCANIMNWNPAGPKYHYCELN